MPMRIIPPDMQVLSSQFAFSFLNLRQQFETIIRNQYKIFTCKEYVSYKKQLEEGKIWVNRVDIDLSCKKAKRLAQMFNELGVRATFFVRLHAAEYNPFAFENYRCLKFIRDSGHEIGYHSEIIDESAIWGEDAAECLRRDTKVLETMFDIHIVGVASHGGMTGLNNLDFWKDKRPEDFGLLYEAYDTQPDFDLFHNSLYVSDSSWTRWKCYNRGILVENDHRNLAEHSGCGHPVIYSLIHPETYYDEHFYE